MKRLLLMIIAFSLICIFFSGCDNPSIDNPKVISVDETQDEKRQVIDFGIAEVEFCSTSLPDNLPRTLFITANFKNDSPEENILLIDAILEYDIPYANEPIMFLGDYKDERLFSFNIYITEDNGFDIFDNYIFWQDDRYKQAYEKAGT